ncbi:alpha/beta hydrolase family protein [Lutispora thermophila]|uniref:Alpha/beta hydrolase family protein n=1 Tax=Lutispora thermophila DSM 19022 TaxID=1122184 RepID=A0A1M6GE38_9FIRM|nr:alpha/beta hydrolase [Lutispora thermophila]SHJ08183.1 Alpha/beta hydrolase of unknown function [Lutispora thermophila DSM 19022]
MIPNETIDKLIEDTTKVIDPHRQFYKVRFDDNSMDFAFQWALGCIRNGGGEIGEMFYTASRIEDYNPDSWAEEWPKMAHRVEIKAETSEEKGHKISAREFYMRASCYYRAALTSLLPQNEKYMKWYQKSIECISKAAALSEPEIELINIPFENTYLPGCFVKAANDRRKSKTILAIGGAETFFIDLYFQIGPSALKHGYNFITVDIPGQGILPTEAQFFRPDTEKPIGAILDYLHNRPEVDIDHIAAYGISGGGYYVPRASAYDKRIKACIANCAVTNIGKIMEEMAIKNQDSAKSGIEMSPFNIRMFQIMAWRHGITTGNISDLLTKTRDFTFDPSFITCPVLNICSNGEYLNPVVKAMEDDFMQSVPNSNKKMVVALFEDGGGAHCIGENTGLLSSLVFDWLDEIFKIKDEVNTHGKVTI